MTSAKCCSLGSPSARYRSSTASRRLELRRYVGTHEWLGVASLGLLGVDNEPALAFTILLHAAWYVPTTLVGAFALGARGAHSVRRRRRSIQVTAIR